MSTEHTPTPWTWIKSNASSFVHVETDTDHRQVATVNRGKLDEREANAAFIVRACNNHARLIRALDELLEQIDCLNDIEMCRDLPRHEAEACWDGALNAAQDALKLAKEGV